MMLYIQIFADICWITLSIWILFSQNKQKKRLDIEEQSINNRWENIKEFQAMRTAYKIPLIFDKLEFIRIADEIINKNTIYTWHCKSHGINFWIKGTSNCFSYSYLYHGMIEDKIISSCNNKEEAEKELQSQIAKYMNYWCDFANKYSSYEESDTNG